MYSSPVLKYTFDVLVLFHYWHLCNFQLLQHYISSLLHLHLLTALVTFQMTLCKPPDVLMLHVSDNLNSIPYIHYLKALDIVRLRPYNIIEKPQSSHNEPTLWRRWREKKLLTGRNLENQTQCGQEQFCNQHNICQTGCYNENNKSVCTDVINDSSTS